jgi:hypothetical protein
LPPSWPTEVGLLCVATFFALLQSWAIHSIIIQFPARPFLDSQLYITQALKLQNEPITLVKLVEFGLYPLFLAQFNLGSLDWVNGANDPRLQVVYYTQSLMLCAASAVFLLSALILIPGKLFRRIILSVLLGCVLLSPLIIVWPAFILTDAQASPTILLFACA